MYHELEKRKHRDSIRFFVPEDHSFRREKSADEPAIPFEILGETATTNDNMKVIISVNLAEDYEKLDVRIWDTSKGPDNPIPTANGFVLDYDGVDDLIDTLMCYRKLYPDELKTEIEESDRICKEVFDADNQGDAADD